MASAPDGEPLSIRLALPHEAALVHQIMLAAFDEYRDVLTVPSSAHGETVHDVAAAMSRGGAVLAWAGATAVGSARYQFEPEALYVGRVSVLPSHRRRGVARDMMRFIEHLAPELGRHVITLRKATGARRVRS